MPSSSPLTFPKKGRLCRKRDIEALFSSGGHSLSSWPIRAVWRETDDSESLRMLVSVGKRHFKHAVQRNRLKRLVREAWRKHRFLLLSPQTETPDGQTPHHLHVAFLWTAPQEATAREVEEKVENLLRRISERHFRKGARH